MNVPLDFRVVRTCANFYIGEHVPFDMLLGRPWQKGNFVGIEEKHDGMYLTFKDPETIEVVLVTPDRTNRE